MNGRGYAINGRTGTAVVIGVTSDIGRAIARKLANRGYALQLAARNLAWLERATQDIRVRTDIAATEYPRDMLQNGNGLPLLDELDPLPDGAVCVGGLLGDQPEIQRNPAMAESGSNGAAVASSSGSVRWWAAAGGRRTMPTDPPRLASPPSCPDCATGWTSPAFTSLRSTRGSCVRA